MSDLFSESPDPSSRGPGTYDAQSIEVLEGLEPVRKRPGMYIGGTDERALHHLASEILDNAMDEAVAGYAKSINLSLEEDGTLILSDDGRGIPVDPHPKFPGIPAVEVILTTLHSGGKFSNQAYKTAGGLHGVGISVVNALSEFLQVEIKRDGKCYIQDYARGKPLNKLREAGRAAKSATGTIIRFRLDPEIFGDKARFKPARLYAMARAKAYLFKGVEIRWTCAESLLEDDNAPPANDRFHFPNGLKDFLTATLKDQPVLSAEPFYGAFQLPEDAGHLECAVSWPENPDLGFLSSYCNTVPTPQGGTHESGIKSALTRSLRGYGDLVGMSKKAAQITAEDVLGGACALLSVFLREPQFQGQTKEKLATTAASRWVDAALKDAFDHWLTADTERAKAILEMVIERAEDRLSRRAAKDLSRKTGSTRKLRLPGKLTDCSRNTAAGTEIFLVEGDSAGGSAKQARNRETQAVLPLRGKILNVVSASPEKIRANQEIQDLIQAFGCGVGAKCDPSQLRYERVIIMTDADVDGAHISSLLMTFFYDQMHPVIEQGRLYLAQPPLYRLNGQGKTFYARDEAHKDELMKNVFTGKGKVEISRFKGLGEMPAAQLKETTMNPATRTLIRVTLGQAAQAAALTHALQGETLEDSEDSAYSPEQTEKLVKDLMGRNAEARFHFIQEHADLAADLDV